MRAQISRARGWWTAWWAVFVILAPLLLGPTAGLAAPRRNAGPGATENAAATKSEAGGPGVPDCGPIAIAEAMRDLFPPALEPARQKAADRLAACHAVGGEGVLAAALNQPGGPSTSLAITRALATFRSPVAIGALRAVVQSRLPPPVRALAMPALASAGITDDLAAIVGNTGEDDSVRTAALKTLNDGGRPPDRAYLDWLKRNSGMELGNLARELSSQQAPPAGSEATAAAAEATTTHEPAPVVSTEESPPGKGVTASNPPPARPTSPGRRAARTQATAPGPEAPVRTGPIDGTPLAIGASTVAGSALMLNLSLLGFQNTTPQLLLGSAGAAIGFGTAWGLSRFGVKPTMEQAAWFANTTAWGTLAGITVYAGSGADNYKYRYGALIAGEITGMAAGVWSARRWHWTGSEIVVSDSLFLGAGLAAFGLDRMISDKPTVTPAMAYAVVPTMVAAAVAGHALAPTKNDLTLMTGTAIGGGWLGALIAAGGARTDLFASRQGQGGLLAGMGLGYLGGAVAGAFTEVPPLRLEVGAAGMLAGNALGLGVNMMATGLARGGDGLAAGDVEAFKLGAGLGGLGLGAAGFILTPRLVLGPSAVPMTIWGAGYGAGTFWLASAASYHGQPITNATTAVLEGGMLASGVVGGVTGLVMSRAFEPTAADQMTAFGATAATTAVGWGTAAVLTDNRGTADAIGVAAGAALGLSGGAIFSHRSQLRPPALGAAGAGVAYGALLGMLLPSLNQPSWISDRTTGGATMIGLGGGALAGAVLGQTTGATGGQVAVPAVAGVLGLGVGAGAGMLGAADNSRPTRVGAFVGTAAFLGGSVLGDHWLRLSDGLGPSATGLAFVGAGFGATEGVLLAGALDSRGTVGSAKGQSVAGGLLMGASAGITGGLALSRRFAPSTGDLTLTAGNSILLASAGYGVGELVTDGAGRGTTVATMSGAALGLVGGALVVPHVHLTPPVVGASLAGGAAAGLVGSLVPSLADAIWTSNPRTDGGLRVGLATGLLGAGAAAQLTGATGHEVTAASVGGSLGLGVGLGMGSLWPRADTQPERIGTVAGVTVFGVAGALLVRPLHLADPLPLEAPALVVTTTAHGIFDGLLLASIVDASGLPSATPGHQLQGGVLFGGSLALGTGLLLAPHVSLDDGQLLLLSGGTAAGAGIGRGLALMIADTAGRTDSAATLAGSLVGTTAGAIAIAKLDPEPLDAAAAAVGGGYGALLGALAPTLNEPHWSGWTRDSTGGLLLGAGTGAVAGLAARRFLDGDGEQVGATALAGGAGALTGVGWALLLHNNAADPYPSTDETRHLRLGTTIGAAAGLGLGMVSWSRLTLGPGDQQLIAASVTLAAWNGALLPALGHSSANDFDSRRMIGGGLAAAGTTSFAVGLLAPALEVDTDLIVNAMALDGVFTGAGAGVAALASERADAPIAGLLLGGGAGLVLGGALHNKITLQPSAAPLLTLGAVEGLWMGAWLPHVLRAPDQITDGQRGAGIAVGTFGGLGLAILANTTFAPSGGDAAFAGLGSAIGAAMTGGVALMSADIRDQKAVALTLGGTGVGLAAGGYLAPRLNFDLRAAGSASIGGVLGTSEALLFAWSARASSGDAYAGAALLGAGVGTTLGLASAASLDMSRSGTPAIAGFTAWGGWMGSFAGSLFALDAHEITGGGLLGSNLGLLAGYGLLHTGVVEPGDFGWLSLFGAVGTAAGAAAGAPFASQGRPAPILAGLAVGPAVGMAVGAFVLPRLRRSQNADSDAVPAQTVAFRSAPERPLSRFALDMRRNVSPEATPNAGQSTERPVTSPEIARDLESRHRLKRRLARALNASVRISDCAPLIGALPTADSAQSGTTPPMLVGLTGRWQ